MADILYFDAFNGASGDMILGALIDLGLPVDHLLQELQKLNLDGFELRAAPIERQGLRGINFQVVEKQPAGRTESVPSGSSTLVESGARPEHFQPSSEADHSHSHHHDHHHHHHHHDHHQDDTGGSSDQTEPAHSHAHGRSLAQILRLIRDSRLSSGVKQRACLIFKRLGEAEAKVHGEQLDTVHFHEVGSVDAIVDIVGACIGFEYFQVAQFFSSPLALGGGTVTFSHGTWPVPAPATAELVRGFPTLLGGVQAELTTPTGAAIITSLVQSASRIPVWELQKSGFGAGDREFAGIPNMLRLLLGRSSEPQALSAAQEEIVQLEADIDNMDGETLGHFLDLALSRGALDVYYATLHMKKNRPGIQLSVLCRPADRERLARLIFEETTTLGVRWRAANRWILDREVVEVETEFGPVAMKIGRLDGRIVNAWPEYEDIREIARETGQPLKLLRQKLMASAGQLKYE